MFRKAIITAATLVTAFTTVSAMTVTSASAWYGGYGGGYGYHAYVPHCWQQPVYGYDAYGVRIIIGYRHVCG